MKLVPAKCPSCGSNLEIDSEMETCFCMYCGSKIQIQDVIRTIKIDNTDMIVNWMKLGKEAIEVGNHSEAYDFFTKVLEIQPDNVWANLYRGQAALWQSSHINLRLTETIASFSKAFNQSMDERGDVVRIIAEQIIAFTNRLAISRFNIICQDPDVDSLILLQQEFESLLEASNGLAKNGIYLNDYREILIKEVLIPMATQAYQMIDDYGNLFPPPDKETYEKYVNYILYGIFILNFATELWGKEDEFTLTQYKKMVTWGDRALSLKHGAYEYDEHFNEVWKTEVFDFHANAGLIILHEHGWRKDEEDVEKLQKKLSKKMNEEKQKRITDYWVNHPDEKKTLEEKKVELSNRISQLKVECEAQKKPLQDANQENVVRIATNQAEFTKLGLFKKKEKKELQNQINIINNEITENQRILKLINDEFSAKIESINNQIYQVDAEFNKER